MAMDITLTIQIIPDGAPEQRIETYRKLNDWRKGAMSMGNLTMLHLLTQENVVNMIYLTDGVRARLGRKGENAIFNTSRQNATYRILHRTDIPSDIVTNVNTRAIAHFNRYRKEIFSGQRRVPYYRNDSPIPFSKESITFFAEKGKRRIYKFRLFKRTFTCILGKDHAGYAYRLDGILEGTIHHRNPMLYHNGRNDKWFLLLPIPAEEARPDINPSLRCMVTFTGEHPIVAVFGKEEQQFGTAEEFAHRRRQISEKLSRLQADSRYSRGGHGRGQKLAAISRFHEKERNYALDRLHKYSAALVATCIRKGYGTIVLQDAPDNGGDKDGESAHRYWSVGELRRLIGYKARLKGIAVIDG